MSDGRLAEQGALLAEVFPGTRVGDAAYLRWLYRDSPFGPVIAADLVDDDGLAGHYAIVPIDLAVDGQLVRGALSLNTAVHERARGGGVFVRLAEQAYSAGAAEGVEHVIGVANANSTPGFLRRLDFADLGPLPVTVLATTLGRRAGAQSVPAAEAGPLLESAAELLGHDRTSPGWRRAWTPDTLRWRLAAPGSAYAVHRVGGALAVSTVERRGPLRIAILLAVFADQLDGRETRALVREICRHHRAPFALHAGHNTALDWRGLALPDRLRPSPLNLIARALGGSSAPGPPGRLEFLDFDAY